MQPRVLYLASSGIREPLIVSQVLRYLKRMGDDLEVCHLMTLEREPVPEADAIRASLREHRIHWHGLPSYKKFRSVNLFREIWNGCSTGLKLIREHDLNIIHSRSFIPGNIGLRLKKKTGAKFLYDMRGFWAEEKWAKGTIKFNWMRRMAQSMENRLFHGADALVSLTDAGKQRLQQQGVQVPTEVIPCCVDTELFRPLANTGKSDGPLNLISVGALGPGYLPDSVLGIYHAASQLTETRLTLLTRTRHETIQAAADRVGCDLSQVEITSAAPEEVVQHLNRADVGLCMIQPSDAKIASSPTKLAEYLACGLPVIANCERIGDMQAILDDDQIGVQVEQQNPDGWRAAVESMLELRQDPAVSKRCRDVAQQKFSVDVGVSTYTAIYRRLLGG